MRRSTVVSLGLAIVLTVLAFSLGGDPWLLLDVQPYFLIGLVAVLLVAYLNTRREFPGSGGRDRFCLSVITVLASCIVCLGLLLTLIALVKAVWCVRHFRPNVSDLQPNVGDIAMSLLPFVYCLAIAEVACPALARYFDCRIERAEQAASGNKSSSA
ncbi:MAG: hypothetical protein JW889_14425 [Verrucomicrobia bacterium]|nr:hypothetical protein [Verrucomicrobiota bacterium]